jgi:hypothetical protein
LGGRAARRTIPYSRRTGRLIFMAAVYFENPNIITEEDVISIDKKGIKYTRGYIDFSECAANFSRLHEHKMH